MAEGAKANHLAYLGDGSVGAGANIGAGTIFCNYDGFNKAQTEVGAGAFVGSNSSLVAPVTVGAGALVASAAALRRRSLGVVRGYRVGPFYCCAAACRSSWQCHILAAAFAAR